MLQHSLFDVGSAILSEAGAPNAFKSIDINTHNLEQGKQHILNNKIELHASAGTINCIKLSQKSDQFNYFILQLFENQKFFYFWYLDFKRDYTKGHNENLDIISNHPNNLQTSEIARDIHSHPVANYARSPSNVEERSSPSMISQRDPYNLQPSEFANRRSQQPTGSLMF